LGNAKDPTSTVRRQCMLYAVDFNTGKVRWKLELRSAVPLEAKHFKNTYASETPVTDGKRVYVYSGGAHALFAVDFNGKLVWSTHVKQLRILADSIPATPGARFSGDLLNMGSAASPALHNDRIYIVDDHRGPPQDGTYEVGEWFLAAFDARRGREIWRAHHVKKEDVGGWSTPFVWENGLRTEIVTVGDNHVRSFDPDGKL